METTTTRPMTSHEVVETDLAYICDGLKDEFRQMAGSTLLITGAAGFLGHYLLQGALYWNDRRSGGARMRVVALDNFVRGVPGWLGELRGRTDLEVLAHDITQPLPGSIGPADYIVHAAALKHLLKGNLS